MTDTKQTEQTQGEAIAQTEAVQAGQTAQEAQAVGFRLSFGKAELVQLTEQQLVEALSYAQTQHTQRKDSVKQLVLADQDYQLAAQEMVQWADNCTSIVAAQAEKQLTGKECQLAQQIMALVEALGLSAVVSRIEYAAALVDGVMTRTCKINPIAQEKRKPRAASASKSKTDKTGAVKITVDGLQYAPKDYVDKFGKKEDKEHSYYVKWIVKLAKTVAERNKHTVS